MRVAFTPLSIEDMVEIARYIALDSPARADSFVMELHTACAALADLPRAFPLVPRYERSNIRRRPYGNYLIFYRIRQEEVEIIRIISAARDYESLLFPDGPA
jgi:plasmid stabilization system protein ParE